jgi:hypothetical protein
MELKESEMTKKKSVVGLNLQFIWNYRLRLRAEGDKLWAEGNKLHAEGNKLRAEGDKLRAEGDKLWAEAIIAAYGNIKLEWIYRGCDYDCRLENGELFEHK